MPHRIWNSFAGGQYGFKGLKWEAAWCERLGNWDVAQSKLQCGNPKYTGLGTPITWPSGTTFSDTPLGRWATDSPIFHLQQHRHNLVYDQPNFCCFRLSENWLKTTRFGPQVDKFNPNQKSGKTSCCIFSQPWNIKELIKYVQADYPCRCCYMVLLFIPCVLFSMVFSAPYLSPGCLGLHRLHRHCEGIVQLEVRERSFGGDGGRKIAL